MVTAPWHLNTLIILLRTFSRMAICSGWKSLAPLAVFKTSFPLLLAGSSPSSNFKAFSFSTSSVICRMENIIMLMKKYTM